LLEATVGHLRDHPGTGFVDWSQEKIKPIYQEALTCARLARAWAELSRSCDPDQAWVAGLLAPLGWLAVSAADPKAASSCLDDPDFSRQPITVQKGHWGWDQASLARRLARRWNLPPWLTSVVGYLGLPLNMARKFGAEPSLFSVVQAAVAQVQQQGCRLHLEVGTTLAEVVATLGCSPTTLVEISSNGDGEYHAGKPVGRTPTTFLSPVHVPLLPDLLTLAAENFRLRGLPLLGSLEAEVDRLQEVLRETRASQAEQLRDQKLNALAELAAGAGHEINNPLAVISGQAQFLLHKFRPQARPLGLTDLGRLPDTQTPRHPDTETFDREDGKERKNSQEGNFFQEPEPQGNLSPCLPVSASPCLPVSASPRLSSPCLPPPLEEAEVAAALGKIIDQAQRIHLILRELMQFARPTQPNKHTFDLGPLVQEVVTSLTELAGRRPVRLIPPTIQPPMILHADAKQVRTALSCLLRNAIEAAPEGGWAAIRLETPTPDRVDILVEDNGPGPPPMQWEHLFDPFYSGKTAGRGRGLGLPTAWRLARQNGGDVRLVRPPDGPTRFILSLAQSLETKQ
jgi:signal transduction histidine kinase